MIQISGLKLPVTHSEQEFRKKIQSLLRLKPSEDFTCQIQKKSLDARKKPNLYYVYTVEIETTAESRIRKKIKNQNISFRKQQPDYQCIPSGTETLRYRPVIIGTGPAGLFCGYQLAQMGYCPILLERGASMEERKQDVEDFWNLGKLNTESNVQFGEGGAGTFSDGKLNTLVNDPMLRNKEVLRLFVKYGAPENILYDAKPHIGTDILSDVVTRIREDITRMGGSVRFHAKVTDFDIEHIEGTAVLKAVEVTDTISNEKEVLPAEVVVLAIGHSARDTFRMLENRAFEMHAKSFAVGVRVEHPQEMINISQYEKEASGQLPAATYKLTAKTASGRGVYTFCMCPGGYVVNASSEEGRLAVNGMSYSGRSGKNANSAVIVTVTPDDYGNQGVLSGMEFQRKLEEAAYKEGKGNIPVQCFGDFKNHRASTQAGEVEPQMKGGYTWANVRNIFPEFLAASIEEGILEFDKKIPGYAREDALVSGVESRTSSPVRIERNESFQSNVTGVYPCGEGAGYAGGITSAAMDGLKVAEAISRKYHPFDIESMH